MRIGSLNSLHRISFRRVANDWAWTSTLVMTLDTADRSSLSLDDAYEIVVRLDRILRNHHRSRKALRQVGLSDADSAAVDAATERLCDGQLIQRPRLISQFGNVEMSFWTLAGGMVQSTGHQANTPGASFYGSEDVLMPCVACSVVPAKDGWMVECENTKRGPYQWQDVALRVATAEALAFRRNGQRARVSVQNCDGRVSAEYCLCADFNEPKRARLDRR